MVDTSVKVSPLCTPTGQTAGSSGEAVGGSPGNPAVAPSVGAQRPGALSRLASGAALCGVGEGRHHHPSGGAGHHRPADGGLRGEGGGREKPPDFTSFTFLVWECDPVWIE